MPALNTHRTLLGYFEKVRNMLHARRELKKDQNQQYRSDLEKLHHLGYSKKAARWIMHSAQYDYLKAIDFLLMRAIRSLRPEHRQRTLYAIGKLLQRDVDWEMDDVLYFLVRSPPDRPWKGLENVIKLEAQSKDVVAGLVDEGFHEGDVIRAMRLVAFDAEKAKEVLGTPAQPPIICMGERRPSALMSEP